MTDPTPAHYEQANDLVEPADGHYPPECKPFKCGLPDSVCAKGCGGCALVGRIATALSEAEHAGPAVVAERERIAALFCKDCASGRPRIISRLGGRDPFWHHPTGQASGRDCQSAAVWGEARG